MLGSQVHILLRVVILCAFHHFQSIYSPPQSLQFKESCHGLASYVDKAVQEALDVIPRIKHTSSIVTFIYGLLNDC